MCHSDPRSVRCHSELNTQRCIRLKPTPRKRKKAMSDPAHVCVCTRFMQQLPQPSSSVSPSPTGLKVQLPPCTFSPSSVPGALSSNTLQPRSLPFSPTATFIPHGVHYFSFLRCIIFPRLSTSLPEGAATEEKRDSHPLPTLHSVNRLRKTSVSRGLTGWTRMMG